MYFEIRLVSNDQLLAEFFNQNQASEYAQSYSDKHAVKVYLFPVVHIAKDFR